MPAFKFILLILINQYRSNIVQLTKTEHRVSITICQSPSLRTLNLNASFTLAFSPRLSVHLSVSVFFL